MSIEKLVAGVDVNDAAASTGEEVATAVNSLIGTAFSGAGVIPVDLHYGALMGIGPRTGELFSDSAVFTLASSVAVGAKTLTLTNASSGIVNNQLIAIKHAGGYSTHFVTSVSGANIGFSPALDYAVTDLASAVSTFYKDQYHPTTYGYRALADYCVKNLPKKMIAVSQFYLNKNSASSTITTDSTNGALNMGSSVVPAKSVTTSTVATQGAFYTGKIREAGDFIAKLETYSAVDVSVFVSIDGNASYEYLIESGYAGMTEIRFSLKEPYQTVTIRVCAVGTSVTVNVAEVVDIYLVVGDVGGLDYGKHCLLGDSWFAQVGFAERLAELLPNATIVNKGVGGRKAADVLAAFSTDVTERYDFIWCICGTNDYVAGTTQAAYSNATTRIKGLAVGSADKFIMLGSSVGSADTSATEFNLSRQYAKLTEYADQLRLTEHVLSIPATTVAAGANQVLANIGYFDPVFTITGFYCLGAGLSMRHKSTIGGSGSQILTMGDNALSTTKTSYNIGAARMVDVYANNASGSPITYSGYITYLR